MTFTSASTPTTRDTSSDPGTAGRTLEHAPDRPEPDGVLLPFRLRQPPGLPEPHPPNRARRAALASEILTLLAGAYEPEPVAEDTESRLTRSAELAATAISDALIHADLDDSRARIVAALRALARRSAVPVKLTVSASGRLAERIEVTAYYVVSELLTNAVKHARASVVRVTVMQPDKTLHLSVRDDGAGGADPARGSGLIGLRDRVEAIGGTVVIHSPAGAGTTVLVSLPLDGSV